MGADSDERRGVVIVGVLKEARDGERRVAATPVTVEKIRGLGYEVVVDPGAGAAGGVGDPPGRRGGAPGGEALEAVIGLGVVAPPPPPGDPPPPPPP
ncbi:hypothetical protein ACFWGM_32345, partial [Streptomyces roseolus]